MNVKNILLTGGECVDILKNSQDLFNLPRLSVTISVGGNHHSNRNHHIKNTIKIQNKNFIKKIT